MPTKQNAVRLRLQGPEPSLTKLNLTITNKQETAHIAHSTNWDSSLDSTNFRSRSFLNSFSARTFSFASTDLGYHKYDTWRFGSDEDAKIDSYTITIQMLNNPTIFDSDVIEYAFNAEWTPNDIALLDDIAIVATDSYCSTEKKTWNINSSVWTYYFSKISIAKNTTCNELMSMELFGLEETTGEVIDFWIYICLSPEQSGETISVTTFDCLENPTTVNYILPVVNNYTCDYPIQVQSCELFPPTTDWPSYTVSSVAPSPPPIVNGNTGSTIDITTPSEPPPDPIDIVKDLGVNISTLDNIITEKKYDCYYNKNKVNFNYITRSNFFIPMTLGMIYNHNPTDPLSVEVADFSDVYIEINYSKNIEETSSTTASVIDSNSINTDNNRIIYKFGGYVFDKPSLGDLLGTNARFAPSKGKNIIDYENDYFYFPIYDKTLKTITGVVLSSSIDFTLPENREDWNFKGGYVPTGYNRIHGKNIPIDSIKIHKITNYPNCGKVDIYLKKSGFVQEFSYGSIISNKHGLQDYDIIKITDSFNIDLEYAVWQEDNGYIYEESESAYLMIERLNRSLSGIKYVKVIDSFTFQIFDDPELTQIIAVPIQLSFNSSLEWTCIGNHLDRSNQAWDYHSSIYSPDGKNGYGTKRILRQTIENQSTENIEYVQKSSQSAKILIDYATPIPDFPDEPVHYDNSLRSVSWTNHYPFKRTLKEGAPKYPAINNTKVFDMDIQNGNHFGSEVKLLKYNDSTYFMLISERGASNSFKICSSFDLDPYGSPSRPFNCRSIPTFLPYGKIHIYKLNTVNKKISNIEYLKSISAPNHPWTEYENNNIDYRSGKISNNTAYNRVNYGLFTSEINTYNDTDDSYWVGAKFLHWDRSYTRDLFFTDSPNDSNNQTEFGFIDCFGKSFGVELVDNAATPKTNWYSSDLKLIVSTESKNTLDTNLRLYFYNSVCPIYSAPIFNLEEIYRPAINLTTEQKTAASNFMNKVIYKSSNVIFSFASKNYTSIYIYKTTNTQYKDTQYYFDNLSLIQEISLAYSYNEPNIRYFYPENPAFINWLKGFGKSLAFDGNFLVTNALSYSGDNNNVEKYVTDYLHIYKKNRDGQFEFLQKISPTIDISDPKYKNAVTFPVTFSSNNLSYAGTSDNSRTYKTYLLKRYDINNGILVLRDPLEYSVFQYNKAENKFKFKFSNFIDITFDSEDYYYSKRILVENADPNIYDPQPDLLNIIYTDDRVNLSNFPKLPRSNILIKIADSTSPSTFTSRGVFDSSEKKPSMQIFEYSHFYKTQDNINSAYRGGDEYLKIKSGDLSSANYNVLTSIDFPNPNYGLPLYMDVLETSNNSLQLRNLGHSFENSGIPLRLELDIKTNNSGIPLYLKQYDISNSGLKLKTAGHLSAIDGLDLRVESTVKLSDQILNLSMYNPILTTGQFGTLDLRIENLYQGGVAGNDPDPEDPNYWTIGTKHSGDLNLVVKTDEYIDYATRLNLTMPQGSFSQIIETGVNSEILDFYMYGDIEEVPIDTESIVGTGNNTNLNLFLKANVGAPLPLFVYNTLESGSLNLDIRGSYQDASGLNLLLDSKGIPSGLLTFYVRGFEPYA